MDTVMMASPTALDNALHGKNYDAFNNPGVNVAWYDMAPKTYSTIKHNIGTMSNDPIICMCEHKWRYCGVYVHFIAQHLHFGMVNLSLVIKHDRSRTHAKNCQR